MRRLLTLACVILTNTAFGDTPELIAEDYQEKSLAAVKRINETLEKAAVPLLASLVKKGDIAGSETLQKQLKEVEAGGIVMAPHPVAASLFASYGKARTQALEPVRKSAIARIEALLATAEGKKLEVVAALANVRKEIEEGKTIQPSAVANASPKAFLKQYKVPKKWGYFLSPDYEKRYGTFYLNDDGTLTIDAASPGSGTWATTNDPAVLMLDIKNTANTPEKTELILKGSEATLKRVSGMRYLKAD